MNISKFLAKVIGIYLIIIGIGMFLDMHRFLIGFDDIIKDQPLLFVTGFFTLIMGILMVVSHNIWQWNWRVIITIMAWSTLLKGILLVFYPQLTESYTLFFVNNIGISYLTAVFAFITGIILCYFGFKK